MSVWSELKKRNVIKVAVAYTIVAWVLVQVADIFFPALQLPEWTVTLVASLVILGFPLALVLAWAYDITPEGIVPAAKAAARDGARPAASQRLNFVILALVAVAVTLLVVDRFAPGDRAPRGASSESRFGAGPPVIASTIMLPEGAHIAFASDPGGIEQARLALSPNGRWLAYIGQGDSGSRVFRIDLRAFAEPQAIPGTDGAIFVFFSPDSQSIGFLTRTQLKRVPVEGGGVNTIADFIGAQHGYWLDNGWIYVADLFNLWRVPDSGGAGEQVADTAPRTFTDVFASGRFALADPWALNNNNTEILLVDLESGATRPTGLKGYYARWAPTGHLLFARNGNIQAVAFDPERAVGLGEPVEFLQGVTMDTVYPEVQLALSHNGTLAYVPGPELDIARIVTVNREGHIRNLTDEAQRYRLFDLSADDAKVAVAIADVQNYLWLYDIGRGEGRRLSGTEGYGWPVFSRSGLLGATDSYLSTEPAIMVQSGVVSDWRPALNTARFTRITDWSPDGKQLVLERQSKGIGLLPLSAQEQPRWLDLDGQQWGAVFSADGRWLAYVSGETGREEIWARSLDEPARRYQLSVNGGVEPVWCPCGRVFFRRADRFYSVPVETSDDLQFGPARHDFTVPGFLDTPGRSYDVSSDGETVYTLQRAASPTVDRVHVLANWYGEFERLAKSQ